MKRLMKKRFRFPNNEIFILALMLLIVFLLIELLLRTYNLYYHEPLVDIPSHFFAGLAIGTGIFWILSLANIKKIKTFSIIYTAIVAIIWEVLETLQELIIENPPYLQDIFFWDGILDIIITVMGGAFSFIFIMVLIRKRF